MKRKLLLVTMAVLAFSAQARTLEPNYQMICYPPNSPVMRININDYSKEHYGFTAIMLDGSRQYITLGCVILDIPETPKS